MEKWELEEKIRYLEHLNKDDAERPSVKENRQCWIDHFKKLLKIKEEEENEV